MVTYVYFYKILSYELQIMVPLLIVQLAIDSWLAIYLLLIFCKVKGNFDAIPRDQVLSSMVPSPNLQDFLIKHIDIPAPMAEKLKSKELTYDQFIISQQLSAPALDKAETSVSVTVFSPKFMECLDNFKKDLTNHMIISCIHIVFLGVMIWML